MTVFTSKCQYKNCKLNCKNKTHHRSIYASIKKRKHVQKKVRITLPKKSNKINYEKLKEFLDSFD